MHGDRQGPRPGRGLAVQPVAGGNPRRGGGGGGRGRGGGGGGWGAAGNGGWPGVIGATTRGVAGPGPAGLAGEGGGPIGGGVGRGRGWWLLPPRGGGTPAGRQPRGPAASAYSNVWLQCCQAK